MAKQQRQAPEAATAPSAPMSARSSEGGENSVAQAQLGSARGEAQTPFLDAAAAEVGPTPITVGAPAVAGPGTGAIPAAGTPPTITVQNESAAPGGSTTRTRVGAKEKVWLQASTDGGTWTAAGGAGSVLADGTYEWRAPATAGPVAITYRPTGGGAAVVTTMTVVVPATLAATGSTARAYSGQGAGMDLQLQVGPTDVSFANLEWLEDPGPATAVSGYFVGKPADRLAHRPNPSWSPIGDGNALGDVAEFEGWPAPYGQGGSYTWAIPNRWRAGAGTGALFQPSTQVMSISAAGVSSVSKLGRTA